MLAALDATPFVVSLEQRPSAVTDRADVVLPVAAVAEKARRSSTGRAAAARSTPC